MSAWGVGADGGDQRRFAQGLRVEYRFGGRGAEHHHVGVMQRGFKGVGDVQAWVQAGDGGKCLRRLGLQTW
ncbi:hypothetical protein D3C78_1687930 [compost metagenome]